MCLRPCAFAWWITDRRGHRDRTGRGRRSRRDEDRQTALRPAPCLANDLRSDPARFDRRQWPAPPDPAIAAPASGPPPRRQTLRLAPAATMRRDDGLEKPPR